MAAVLALPDAKVEELCASVTEGVVVPANYNCPGQIVISGSIEGVDAACAKMLEAGAKRALKLKVGGAFHSPLMEPARAELADAIAHTDFHAPKCPVYQNVNAEPQTDPETIKKNLIAQLTAPVRWTQKMCIRDRTNSIEYGSSSLFFSEGSRQLVKSATEKNKAKL